jgi:hypothetical protein
MGSEEETMKKLLVKTSKLMLIFVILGLPCLLSVTGEQHTEIVSMPFWESDRILEEKQHLVTDELLQFVAGGHVLGFREGDVTIASGDHALRIDFVGAQSISPEEEGTIRNTALSQKDPRPLDRVIYRDLWPGVSLVYEKHRSGVVKSTYIVEPDGTCAGCAVEQIRLRYNVPVDVDKSGNLIYSFETGQMKESCPVAWQEISGGRVPVDVSFYSLSEQEVGFNVGAYDQKFPLVIDPVLSWNTFMGGGGWEEGQAIAVDSNGNVYVAGQSPTTWGSPVNPYAGGIDAFVAKLNSSGVRLWNTFMGSSGNTFEWEDNDFGYGVAVDSSGNVYVTGYSYATWGSPINSHAGVADVFVGKLNSSGVRQWHTFLGSTENDNGLAIAVDLSGNIYVAGESYATWGTPVNSYAGDWDAFAAKLNSSGVRQWHTFMGSTDTDNGRAIAVDLSGNVYVAGESDSIWGTPVNAFAGDSDAFAAKLNSSGVRQWHTFMGGSLDDYGRAIAIDGSGNVYVAGGSAATWGSPDNPWAGGYDAFAAKLNSIGVRQWNTFMGSISGDYGRAIARDGNGNIYVAGTGSATWGSPVNAYVGGGADVFAAKLFVLNPEPDIKANGSDSTITITEGDPLSVTIELDAGGLIGEDADFWVCIKTDNPPPNKWLYFDLPTKSWLGGIFVTLQRSLFDISSRNVPKTSGLAPGTYTFYFAVDMVMNGSIDVSQAFYDKIKVTITP